MIIRVKMGREKSITISASACACYTNKSSDKTSESECWYKRKKWHCNRAKKRTQKCPGLNDRRTDEVLRKNASWSRWTLLFLRTMSLLHVQSSRHALRSTPAAGSLCSTHEPGLREKSERGRAQTPTSHHTICLITNIYPYDFIRTDIGNIIV